MKLSPHFSRSEMECPCCKACDIDPTLLELLEDVRAHFNRPIIINSAQRCPIHNESVSGSRYSQHLVGKAADFTVVGVSPAKVQQYLADHEGGLGSYTTFTHVDVRGYKARWTG